MGNAVSLAFTYTVRYCVAGCKGEAMGRPRKFTKEEIGAAALEIVDCHGPAGLTMRQLAESLGTGAMTLYNYIGDKNDLSELVIDAILGESLPPFDGNCDWQDEVPILAYVTWRAIRKHPKAAPLFTRPGGSPISAQLAERMVGALSGSGRSGTELLVAFRAVTSFIMGFVQGEYSGPLSRDGEGRAATVSRVQKLPPAQFPNLVMIAAAAAAADDLDYEFREGLNLLLTGLAATSGGGGAPRVHEQKCAR